MPTTGTILDKIVEVKRRDLEQARRQIHLSSLYDQIKAQRRAKPLSKVITGDVIRLIAEVKRASPSRGLLAPSFDPVALAKTYVENGASALSVLTESPHFQGSPEHLKVIKKALGTGCPPVLRKDFLFDPYQVYESRAWGADAILLIAAILDADQIDGLSKTAQELGMECLVEVHDEAEVKLALKGSAQVIGINNRDLKTFDVDLGTTRRLRPLIPQGIPVVAESGIFIRKDVEKLEDWGVNAILVGEALVTAPDVGAKVRELAMTPINKKGV